MSNYKIELERTEMQDLELKKHISDVKDIIKNKVNKDVSGLNSIKVLLENETLGGYIVDDVIKTENLELIEQVVDEASYYKGWSTSIGADMSSVITDLNDETISYSYETSSIVKLDKYGTKKLEVKSSERLQFISTDKHLNIYYGTLKNYVIKMSDSGEQLWKISVGDIPTSGAVDGDGYLYVGTYNGYMIKISSNGKIVYNKSISRSEIKSVSVSESVFAVDGKNVMKFNYNGGNVWETEVNNFPNVVCADNTGGAICGGEYNRLIRLDKDGTSSLFFNCEYYAINDIAIDNIGYVYVSNTEYPYEAYYIYKFDNTGERILSIKNMAIKLAVDSRRNLYLGMENGTVELNNITYVKDGYKVLKVERGQ